ncbi:MAG TPA: phage baseplate assembly protein V [Methylomusa anaerophila]|uniref:Phage-related baseplate assembly protein n=1 Tax=Methylomusa anaerophila TaxID=1930071 RepID=A0A348AJ13_9FIRM|nr:phage baseplate assembly protein V [Methylomusa anaerophila]BBB91061.1 phage-related baseplate assembly protein [Methylomusa anaerophila]HML88936.1 phage baseplate assembly protein V [Methylomusa anaerophila]
MAGIEEFVRVGEVVSVNDNHTVRVKFADRGEMVSFDLPVLVPSTIDPQDYDLPVETTPVVCIFLPNGQQQGFILGAYYTEINPAPIKNKKKHLRKYTDGTSIEYDMSSHTLTAVVKGPVNITTTEKITINGNLQVNGNINASGSIIDAGGNTNHHGH